MDMLLFQNVVKAFLESDPITQEMVARLLRVDTETLKAESLREHTQNFNGGFGSNNMNSNVLIHIENGINSVVVNEKT